MIETIQQILKETIPTLNTRVGSAIYHFLIIPMVQIANWIQSKIDAVDTGFKPENFGLPTIIGKKGVGKVELVLNSTYRNYYFPVGTLFTNAVGDEIQSTEEVSTSNTTIVLNVETRKNESKIYSAGMSLTCSIYSTLVLSCTVSSTISGGIDDETSDQWETKIKNSLAQNTCSIQGIKNKIKEEYPSLIDAKYHQGYLLIKSPLEIKTVTLNNTNTIYDCIAKIEYSSMPIINIEKINEGLITEKNTFTVSLPVTIKYYSPTLLASIDSYTKNNNIFPVGYSINIKHAPFVFIEMDNCPVDYINTYPINSITNENLYNQAGYHTILYNGNETYEGIAAFYGEE